jgi:hypothetical protein
MEKLFRQSSTRFCDVARVGYLVSPHRPTPDAAASEHLQTFANRIQTLDNAAELLGFLDEHRSDRD